MNKPLLPILLAFCAAALACRSAVAAPSGPYEDFRHVFDENPLGYTISITIPTSYKTTSWSPGQPPVGTIVKDSITITITIDLPWERRAIPLGGFAWNEADPATGALHITTMYGYDPDPTSSALSITGFTPAETVGVRFEDERFFGRSGTEYLGQSLGAVSLGELPEMFPGFDLSPIQGDPSSLVHVFQTTIPMADVPVPEPSTLAMAAAFGVLLLARRRMRRRFM